MVETKYFCFFLKKSAGISPPIMKLVILINAPLA